MTSPVILKKARDKQGMAPLVKHFEALVQARTADILHAASLTALTDNSTGVAGTLAAVVTGNPEFTHVSGNDLADKAGFDAAIGVLDNAVAVLAGNVNQMLGDIAHPVTIAPNSTGVVAVAGTIPAITKTLAGTAGATALAADRGTANAQLQNAVNNLSTVISAFNYLNVAVNQSTLLDGTGGSADHSNWPMDTSLALYNSAATAAAVTSAGDALSLAAANAAMTTFANNVATLAAAITAFKTAIGTKVAVLLLP